MKTGCPMSVRSRWLPLLCLALAGCSQLENPGHLTAAATPTRAPARDGANSAATTAAPAPPPPLAAPPRLARAALFAVGGAFGGAGADDQRHVRARRQGRGDRLSGARAALN